MVGDAGTTPGSNTTYHAFVYSHGLMTDLGTLGGTSSSAAGINNAAQIVGSSTTAGNVADHAFLYSNGTMTDLGTLGHDAFATGINDAGQVVGGDHTVDGARIAFLYSHGSLIDLNTLLDGNSNGWHLERADAINNNGQIVGYMANALSQEHAFLLTPGNAPPVCRAGQASPTVLWSPNHQFVPIVVKGVTDPDGDAVTITVTGVTQDEPVNGQGDGNTSLDAVIQVGAASVRAERSGKGNGRVYQVSFKADDGKGGVCNGAVTVGVPHSLKKGLSAIDDGQLYDSTIP